MREGLRYAFLFDDLYAVTLCGTFFFSDVFDCAVVLVFARGLALRRGAKKCFLSCSVEHGSRKLVFQKIESSWVFFLQSISGIGNKKSWFSQKRTSFLWKLIIFPGSGFC